MTIVFLIISALFQPDAYVAEFQRGNSLYEEAEYERAVAIYERLLSEGIQEPEVYFNLGNAYYRLGKKGMAIANFEKALQVDPRFSIAAENLDIVVKQTKNGLPDPALPTWYRTIFLCYGSLGPHLSLKLGLILWIMAWTTLGLCQLWFRRSLVLCSLVLMIISVQLIASVWIANNTNHIAVACKEEVPVRYGMGIDQPVRFKLYEGDRVLVESIKDDWIKVKAAGGIKGWSRLSDFAIVSPKCTLVATSNPTSKIIKKLE